jgi:glutamyl-Q tRNA(Asp) synthetase
LVACPSGACSGAAATPLFNACYRADFKVWRARATALTDARDTGSFAADVPAHRCGRFAPSPTGRLPFGSLVAALGSWLYARAAGARWLVRMEDLDREREVPGAADDILATLAAFGLHADADVVFQSRRAHAYATALERLGDAGHAYRCACSRADLEPFGGIHPRVCVTPSTSQRTPAWRVRVPRGDIRFDDAIQGAQRWNLAETTGDFVIWRVEGNAAYQLAVVVDDAAQGVDLVVRGADLLDSTPRQLLLQRLLGLPQPAYAHLPLALDAKGRKLSKHDGARAVDGANPMPALRAALAFLGQDLSTADTPAALLASAARAFQPQRIACIATVAPSFAALRKEVC